MTEGNIASITVLNLEGFLRAVGDIVERFGLENFFYLPDSSCSMKYLPENPCTFTLASILVEHESRLLDLSPVLYSSRVETPSSIID